MFAARWICFPQQTSYETQNCSCFLIACAHAFVGNAGLADSTEGSDVLVLHAQLPKLHIGFRKQKKNPEHRLI